MPSDVKQQSCQISAIMNDRVIVLARGDFSGLQAATTRPSLLRFGMDLRIARQGFDRCQTMGATTAVNAVVTYVTSHQTLRPPSEFPVLLTAVAISPFSRLSV
jgi:hypothetical protein